MRTRKPLIFEEIPAWAVEPADRSRYTVAAAFHLAGLTDKWVRLTAASQRLVFGAVLFGKCLMRATCNGLGISRTVCFGTDAVGIIFGWERLEKVMAEGRRPTL